MESKEDKKVVGIKSLVFILVPSIVLYGTLVAIAFAFWNKGDFVMSGLLLAVVIISVIIQMVYTKLIVSKYHKVNVETLSKTKSLLEEQEQIGKMLIRRDLELTRANEKLQKLDKQKSEFIGVVAHQLRTPLSGIKWTISMVLNEELKSKEERNSFLKKAYESNDRVIQLVNDMLLADRIESASEKYVFTSVQLTRLLDEVLFEIMPKISEKKGSVRVDNIEKALPEVRADSTKIRAVLQNLLENSAKYIKNEGNIVMRLDVVDKFVQFSVKDDGMGIPLEQQSNIFTRFFRGSNAMKMITEGSGLGLFIARSIVNSHGGKIWFESEEDKGTTFFFTLPIF